MPAGAQYQHDSDALVEGLEGNTLRYAKLLAEAADEVMPEPSEDLALADAIDVLHQQARCWPVPRKSLWPFGMRGWDTSTWWMAPRLYLDARLG